MKITFEGKGLKEVLIDIQAFVHNVTPPTNIIHENAEKTRVTNLLNNVEKVTEEAKTLPPTLPKGKKRGRKPGKKQKSRTLEMKNEDDDDYPFISPDDEGNGDASDEPDQPPAPKKRPVNGEASDIDDLLDEGIKVSKGAAKAPTLDAVNDAAREFFTSQKAKDKDAAKALTDVLGVYGVSRVRELDPSVWSAFIQKCQSLI